MIVEANLDNTPYETYVNVCAGAENCVDCDAGKYSAAEGCRPSTIATLPKHALSQPDLCWMRINDLFFILSVHAL